MKKIILMRHGHAASSGTSGTAGTDRLRKLDNKGILQVSVIGKKMIHSGILPDYVICSDALRAVQTAEIIATTLELDLEIKKDARLYSASPELYVQLLQNIPDIYSSAMIIAHNPVMEEVVSLLTGKKAGMGSSDLFEAQLALGKWKEFTLSAAVEKKSFFKASE